MKAKRTQCFIAAVFVCALGANARTQEAGKLTPLPDKLPPSLEARVGRSTS